MRPAEGREGQPLEWTADRIVNSDQPLRHIRSDWASKAELSAALRIHPDTVHRRASALGVRTRLEVTARHRCRVMYWVDDVRRLMLQEGAP